jgi:outer membrane protein OmpA-like peptidoglycan-associated protein
MKHGRSFVIGTLGGLFLIVGCGGTTAFEGKSAIDVAGNLPPPPPKPAPPKRVELKADRITITEKVQFEVNSANILPVSHSLLGEVAEVIKTNPQIQKLQVEGHASAEGSAQRNLTLSKERAGAIREYLISQGVDAKVLVSKGFGSSKPVGDNDTEEGREKNRRVEFNILAQDAKAAPAEAEKK